MHDRVNEAWDSVRAGIIRAVSIGFRALEDGVERLASGGLRFKAIEILELSLVAVPANQDCTIDVIKRYAGGQITKAPLVAQTATPTEVREALDAMEPLAERFRRGLDSPYSAEKLAAAISRGGAHRLIADALAVLRTGPIAELLARVAALEAGLVVGTKFLGVWQRQQRYPAGSLATHKGALWHCNTDLKGVEPGDGRMWTMCAKSDEPPRPQRGDSGPVVFAAMNPSDPASARRPRSPPTHPKAGSQSSSRKR